MLEISTNIQIPDEELEFSFARSGGPGGQNVNKVNSKALLRWRVSESNSLPWQVKDRFLKKYANRITAEGEIILQSQEFRDQPGNIESCLEKLKEMILSVLVAPTPRRPTKPSKAAKEKRIQTKKIGSVRKEGRKQPRFDD